MLKAATCVRVAVFLVIDPPTTVKWAGLVFVVNHSVIEYNKITSSCNKTPRPPVNRVKGSEADAEPANDHRGAIRQAAD